MQGKSLPDGSSGLLSIDAGPYGDGVFKTMWPLVADRRAKAVAMKEMVFEGMLIVVRAGRNVGIGIVVCRRLVAESITRVV